MDFPAHIFKAYDIRGLAEKEITPKLAYRVGRAFVALLEAELGSETGPLPGRALVVGRDMRPTSPELQEALMRGIKDSGVDVKDIGLTSTPLFNFACAHYPEHAGGIMVTASHNPAEYNGFKLTRGNGLPVPGQALRQYVASVNGAGTGGGSAVALNPLPDYLDKIFLLAAAPNPIKPLKVVIDFGNGMGVVTFRKLLERLPKVEAHFLYEQPDGNFPNHEANPLKTETLQNLQKKVLEAGADFGFALDGDADRIGLVDERGEVVDASSVAALIGLVVARNYPKALMLYDLRSSMIIKEYWEKEGGAIAKMCRVGHAFIKKQMKEEGAVFASELSLHLYYHDLYDLESPELSFIYLLHLLTREEAPLSQITLPLKKYWHSGEINFSVKDKTTVLSALEKKYGPQASEISHLDGLWLKFDWGWFNVRASNTEPVLRLNLEATTKEVMEEKREEISEIIRVT